MLGRTDRRWRSVVILGAICAFAFAAVVRLAYWQVAEASWLRERAQGQVQHSALENAVRGDILDRNGRVLATTGFRDTLAAWPDQMYGARERTLANLAEILDLDEDERQALDEQLDREDQYETIRRELTEEQSRAVRAGIADQSLRGLVLLPHPVRIYPNPGGQPDTTLASHLLGFVRASDDTGHYGIEGKYNDILAGRPTKVATARDRFQRTLGSSAEVIEPGADGEDVTISIDASLQLQLEKELYAAWVADKAKRVSGLVMDPATGEVLAWASVPGYDANDSGNVATNHMELLRDPIISEFYEPGSVMKMVTAASALENGVVTPGTRIIDSSGIRFGSQVVRNADRKGMGRIPFRDVVAYSRNVAVSRVAARLGRTTKSAASTLYKTWRKLGIGQPTGIDLAGEVAGIAPDPRDIPWAPVDLANRSFGQGIATTPVQLAAAFTPMVNGGLRVQPHFLMAIEGRPQAVAAPDRVLTKKVAKQLKGIMEHVTGGVSWYAEGSLIPRYTVGGKTGTAQIWRSSQGRFDRNTYNFSFVGFVGGDEPAAVVALRIDEADPRVPRPGDLDLSIKSFELFRRVALGIISTQEVRRSSDPTAGRPEPGSGAERVLDPARYARRMDARKGSR
jgi:cell division protein FtsI/penicillin-binding protein 2